MDHSEDKDLGSMDRSNGEYPESDLDGAKSCEDCGATETPLWRGGPSGPKSLCNACGIRYRKRGRGDPGLKGGGKERRMGVSFKWSGWGRRRDVLMKQRRWAAIQKQGMLREEEEAAVLLMALSSGLLCSSTQKI